MANRPIIGASRHFVQTANPTHTMLDEVRFREANVMAKLIFSLITSVDGYIEDKDGDIRWGAPDDEVASFVNDLEQTVGTYLYGRRMYETMVFWETAQLDADDPPSVRDFKELWQAADKVVYSRSLEAVSSAKTRIERDFDPGVIQALKSSEERDISVSGANLAAQALKAGIVDECQLYVTPVVLGGGKPALPSDVRVDFELVDERRFRSGVVFLHYRTSRGDSVRP
jgi:dihydrofolate reductase